MLLILAVAALLALGLLSLGSYIAWFWLLELLSHFRVQYLILSLIVTGVLLILWKTRHLQKKVLIFAALAVVSLNAVEVIPWYLPHPQQIAVHAPKQIKVLQFNVNIQNDHYQEVIDVVRAGAPDVALFIEVDQTWVDNLKSGLNNILPYSFKSPAGGLAVFSSLPISNARGDTLNGKNYNLLATLEVDKQPIQLIGTHPLVPIRPWTFGSRNRQLEVLSNYIQGLNSPVILLGDFNLTPWSPYYRRFTRNTKLYNTRQGYGILPTWPRPATHVNIPNWLLPLMNIPIDHCFVSKHFRVAAIRTGANGNSDHASLITQLVLQPPG